MLLCIVYMMSIGAPEEMHGNITLCPIVSNIIYVRVLQRILEELSGCVWVTERVTLLSLTPVLELMSALGRSR